MSNPNTIQSLEEALRIFWLESAQGAAPKVSEDELKLILSSEQTFEMSDEKRAKLINGLFDTIKSPSLASLLTDAIATKKVSKKKLATEIGVPLTTINELTTDTMFPNNLPVVLMANLLKRLKISWKTAENAILKTYEIMMMSRVADEYSPAIATFRKNSDLKTKPKRKAKANGRDLYENRDAVLKYIAHLKKSMDNVEHE